MLYLTNPPTTRQAPAQSAAGRGNGSITLSSGITCICQDERPFTLRQIDQARGDLYAIGDDLEFIREQLAQLPTRREPARLTLLAALTTAAPVPAGSEALFR